MRTHPAFRRVLAAAFLAAALLPLSAQAAPAPPAPDADPAVSPVEKARQGLDRVVTLKIDRQTLTVAVAQLSEKARVRIVLDTQAIQQLGIAPDQTPAPVQAELKDVKARTALRTVLAPYDLTFVVIGDSILVTTEDMATARQMGQHVSVNFDKVEFAAALKQIARETAVNLALDPRAEKEASARVSLQVDDMPLETAVRLLAEMAGLKPVRAGNALFVTKKSVAAELRGDPDLAGAAPVRIKDYAERDVMIWQVQGRAMPAPAVSIPISAAPPIAVKPIEGEAPAPNLDPAPEKKDGDK